MQLYATELYNRLTLENELVETKMDLDLMVKENDKLKKDTIELQQRQVAQGGDLLVKEDNEMEILRQQVESLQQQVTMLKNASRESDSLLDNCIREKETLELEKLQLFKWNGGKVLFYQSFISPRDWLDRKQYVATKTIPFHS